MTDESDTVEVFTDGSASVKARDGGWAFVARHQGRQLHRFGFELETTISRMELLAIHQALRFINLNAFPIRIYSDSEYAINCLTLWHIRWAAAGWVVANGDSVKHGDLIQDTLDLLGYHRRHRLVEILWIRGHVKEDTHICNRFADGLCSRARKEKITNWSA